MIKETKKRNFGEEKMELISGFPLFMQQVIALLKKNFIISWRSRWVTFLQLFSSLFFVALLFAIQKTQEYRTKNLSFGNAVYDPKALINPAILACEEKLFINLPYYDFVWSGIGSERIESVVTRMMSDNPGRPIPAKKNYFSAWLVSAFVLWSVLAIYLDNIILNSASVRKSIIYFLSPSYWNKLEEDVDSFTGSSTALPNHFTLEYEDVHQEENSIKRAARESGMADDIAVHLRGLAKTYFKRIKIDLQPCCFWCFYCKCKMEKSFDAVRDQEIYVIQKNINH